MRMATKFGMVATYLEWLLPIKSFDHYDYVVLRDHVRINIVPLHNAYGHQNC